MVGTKHLFLTEAAGLSLIAQQIAISTMLILAVKPLGISYGGSVDVRLLYECKYNFCLQNFFLHIIK